MYVTRNMYIHYTIIDTIIHHILTNYTNDAYIFDTYSLPSYISSYQHIRPDPRDRQKARGAP
jgi:hypothetical protein